LFVSRKKKKKKKKKTHTLYTLSPIGLDYSDLNFSQEIVEWQENSTKTFFDVLKRDAVAQLQRKALAQVTAVLGESFPLAYARLLLEAYKWDELKALNAYTENPEATSKMLGFVPPNESAASASTATTSASNSTCGICMDDEVERDSLVALWCGHTFCTDCWRHYLSMKVKEHATNITCPGATANKKKCTLVVDDATVAKLLGDEDALQRHAEALVDSYVQQRSDLRWCVAPKCTNIIRLTARAAGVFGSDETTCLCGVAFCFGCGEVPHRPATCDMLREWKKKAGGGDEDMSVQLIATVSRPCPNCKSPIEKNDGCNHMSCVKCSYHFCWHCMGKFGSGPLGSTDGYSTHKCNALFQPDKDTLSLQNELKVFQHYNDRYLNHMKSRELVKQRLDEAPATVAQIMATGKHAFRHAQFIVRAYEQDIINRTTIMMSYVFGYYRARLTPFVNKDIFENLQGALERHTEILTAAVAKKSVAEVIRDESVIVNATRSAANVRAALLDAASSWDDSAEHRKPAEPINKRSKLSTFGFGKKVSAPQSTTTAATSRAPQRRAPDQPATAAAAARSPVSSSPPGEFVPLTAEMAADMTPEEIELQLAIQQSMAEAEHGQAHDASDGDDDDDGSEDAVATKPTTRSKARTRKAVAAAPTSIAAAAAKEKTKEKSKTKKSSSSSSRRK
jgi:ariadne-1